VLQFLLKHVAALKNFGVYRSHNKLKKKIKQKMRSLLVLLLTTVLLANAGDPVRITFQNMLSEDLDVYWLNPDSYSRSFIVKLGANADTALNSYVVSLFVLNLWRIDEDFRDILSS
jgi:hypothetical protein